MEDGIPGKNTKKRGRPALKPQALAEVQTETQSQSFVSSNTYPPTTLTDAPEVAKELLRGVIEPKKVEFLLRLCRTGIRTRAAQLTGVSAATVYQWNKNDPAFAKAYVRCMEIAGDLHEDEAMRRASEGTMEPIFQGGKLVGQVRRFSDQLLMFVLKGAKPEKYADRHKVDVSVDVADRLVKARERAFGRLEAAEEAE